MPNTSSYLLLLIAVLAGVMGRTSPAQAIDIRPGFIEELLQEDPRMARIAAEPEKYRLQLLVTIVRPLPDGGFENNSSGFRVDEEYFYPASTVKLCAAVSALQLIDRLGSDIDPASILLRRDAEPEDETPITDTLRRMLIVSDNDSFNRLYDLIGHERLNRSMWEAGLTGVRLNHRLSTALTPAQNRETPAADLLQSGGHVLWHVDARESELLCDNAGVPGIEVGTGQMIDGKLVPEPKSFLLSNRVPLTELHKLTLQVLRPDLLPPNQRIELSERARTLLAETLATLPRDSRQPEFDPAKYPDDWGKFMLPGLRRAFPEGGFNYAGKIGLAYGFTTETACIENSQTGAAVIITATLYTNDNDILNDDCYEYDSVAFPFWEALGEVVARRLLPLVNP